MEQETIWIIAVVALAVGVLIGYLMGKSGGNETRRRILEDELKGSRAEMDRYKQEVTSHFEQTANLVNELTEQYRKVHQHLATGAQNLCPDQTPGRALQSSLQPKLEATPNTVTQPVKAKEEAEPTPEAPKDWAPKKPDDEGTLSDRYGLKKSTDSDLNKPPQPDPGLNDDETEKPGQK